MEIQTIASGSSGNCYRISDGQTALLIECGLPIKKIKEALNYQLSDIQAVLVTHFHIDHSKSASDMVKSGIDCYMTKPTKDELEIENHRVKIIEPQKQFAVGTWTILPFETQHDCEGSVGFLLVSGQERVLFATDTYYLKYKFEKLTRILIECNHSYEILNQRVADGILPDAQRKRLIQSHFSLENVLEFLKANDLSRLQEIHLIHLSAGNSNAEHFKTEVMKATGIQTYICGG